jgi:hypothetical protein
MLTVRQTGGVGAVSAGISEAIVEAFLIGLVVFVASWVGLRLAHRQSNRRERSR